MGSHPFQRTYSPDHALDEAVTVVARRHVADALLVVATEEAFIEALELLGEGVLLEVVDDAEVE